MEEGEWRTLALQRMAKVLRTHVIKFDFEDGKTLDKGKVRRYPFPLLLNQFLILMSVVTVVFEIL